jgi:hypothetical protein
MSNKFMFFENFKDTADKLPDDLRLKFYDALTNYAFKGIEPDDAIIGALVNALKPSLDKVDGRKNNGGNHNPNGVNQHNIDHKEVKVGQSLVNSGQLRSIPLETETETETENNIPPIKSPLKRVDDTQLDLEDAIKKAKRFVKPTIAEIQSYCQEKNKVIDADRFWNFYESKGWKVGKSPMKDWRAAVCNWAKDSKPIQKASNDECWF